MAGWKSGAFSLLGCSSMSHVRQNSRYRRGQGNSACFAADTIAMLLFKRWSFRSMCIFSHSLRLIHHINIILRSVNFSRHDHGYIHAYRPICWIYPPPRMPVTTRRCQEQQPFFSFTDSFQWCSASSQYRGVAQPSAPVDMKKHRIRSELQNKFACE